MPISKEYFITIVVTVYNEEETIEPCLESLLNQNYGKKEILVIDDGSTDRSWEIVCKIANQNPSIKPIQTEHKGISHARNTGIKAAKGILIAFAEADAIYDLNWLKYCSEHFADPEVAGVLSPHYILYPNSLVSKCLDTFWVIRFKHDYKPFAAYIYRKKVLEDAKGFDEELAPGEDRDLGIRITKLSYKFVYEPRTKFLHREPNTIPELISKSFWRGKNRVKYCIKQKDFPYLRLGFFTSILISLLLSIFDIIFLKLSCAITISVFMIYFLRTLRKGWKFPSRRKYLFPLSLLMLLECFFSIMGFIIGMFNHLINLAWSNKSKS